MGMNKTKLVALQVGRVVTAFLAVMWTISLLGVFAAAFAYPERTEWWRVILAVAVTALPGWIYTKLTRAVELEKQRSAMGSGDEPAITRDH